MHERGLSARSVASYQHHARPFLAGLAPPLDTVLAELSAAQVTAFMADHRGRWGAGTAKATVTALRSLLRFLHATGRVPHSLAAVPSVPRWRLAPLPADVNPEHVAALLASCDRRSAGGRRDYAILMLLSRLGLRAGEVAAIELVVSLSLLASAVASHVVCYCRRARLRHGLHPQQARVEAIPLPFTSARPPLGCLPLTTQEQPWRPVACSPIDQAYTV